MKLLSTSGWGFSGSNLAGSFLLDGAEVIVIDTLFRSRSATNLRWLMGHPKYRDISHRFHFVPADLADYEAVNEVLRSHAPFDHDRFITDIRKAKTILDWSKKNKL